MLSLSDVILLAKKILIGILVAIVPFLIIFGGLWITQRTLGSETTQTESNLITEKP